MAFRNPATLELVPWSRPHPRTRPPSSQERPDLPNYQRPRLAGRSLSVPRFPPRSGGARAAPAVSCSLDNPSLAKVRTRRLQHPRASPHQALSPPGPRPARPSLRTLRPNSALQPSHLRAGRPPSSRAPRRRDTGGPAAAAPGAPAGRAGRAWRRRVSRGPRAPPSAAQVAAHTRRGPGAGCESRGRDARLKAEWEGPRRPALLPGAALPAPAADPGLRAALHPLCSTLAASRASRGAGAASAPRPLPPPPSRL